MKADPIRARYAATLQEKIIVRRYTGTGNTRTPFEATIRGRVLGYGSQSPDLIAAIPQEDLKVMVLADDLVAFGIALPLTTDDKLVINGKEVKIMNPVPRTAMDGTLVAYELQVRG